MKLEPQRVLLPVRNVDDIISNNVMRENRGNDDLFPNTIRTIICGSSYCGKTNTLFSLIFNPNGLRFKNIYLYSKSLNQPNYEFLFEIMNNICSHREKPGNAFGMQK